MKKINNEELHNYFIELKQNNVNFENFYAKYRSLIYAIAFSILKNKEDSDDVTQKVFVKIWNIDKNKLPICNESNWIYSVTKNESINHIRSKKTECRIQDIYHIGTEDCEIDNVIERETFNKIIEKLKQTEKEIISLRIIGNLSFQEISKLLNLSIGTVEWKYYKSIKELRRLINNLGIFTTIFIIFTTRILNEKNKVPNSLEIINKTAMELNFVDIIILVILLIHSINTIFSIINFIKFKKNNKKNVSK